MGKFKLSRKVLLKKEEGDDKGEQTEKREKREHHEKREHRGDKKPHRPKH